MQKQKLHTPIEEVLFRSSAIGVIAQGLSKNDLTDSQRLEMEELIARTNEVIGLSDKQQEKLDSYEARLAELKPLEELQAAEPNEDRAKQIKKLSLTPSQMAEHEDFKARLTTLKTLTPNQQEKLDSLIEKDNAEPELSQGAKTAIKEIWLRYEKGFKQDIHSKYLNKGLQSEEDAINLISFVDGIMYKKNEERVTKGHLTGECDVNTKIGELKVIDDTKACWNPLTFMNSKLSPIYEWQGHSYLYLYDADIFRLRYCLVDCPPEVYNDELRKFCWNKNIFLDDNGNYKEDDQPLIDQFNRNFLYEKYVCYNREERVKTFQFERDPKKEAILLKSVDLALEYYQTITLNMID